MSNRPFRIFAALSIVGALFAAAAVTPAGAQPRRRAAARARARAYLKADVEAVIKRVENRTDDFVKLFDRALDRGNLDGSGREDRLNERARELERAPDELRREFDRKESYAETRPEVRRCLNVAEGINDVMKRRRMGAQTERTWAALRAELNALAAVYELSPIR